MDKDKLIKYLTIALVIVVLAGGLFVAWPTYQRYQSLKREYAALQVKIEDKRVETNRYVENQQRFRNDPDFVERIARQNGRVFPGELVFIFGAEKDR